MIKEDLPIYGFVSPGWPLSSHANGIVTYIHNIRQGFKNKADIMVLSNAKEIESSKDMVYEFHPSRNLKQRIETRFLSFLPHSYSLQKQYDKKWENIAKSIENKLSNLPHRLTILEIEETFGIAKYLKPILKTPIVTRLHGPYFIHGSIQEPIKGNNNNYRLFVEGQAIKVSDGITSPSQDVLDRVREFYDIELNHAAVIPNPIFPIEEYYKWGHFEKANILFVGRFDFHKGGDLVIDAFRKIAIDNKDVCLNFVGDDRGINIEGKKYNFCEYVTNKIKEKHILDRIHFHGIKNPLEIAQFRRNSTITLMASRYENFSMSLLEALASGCPVVASNVGGNPEIITNFENGILVEPNNSEAIADAVNMLLNDASLMKNLSINAIADVEKRFHPSVIASQTDSYFKQFK